MFNLALAFFTINNACLLRRILRDTQLITIFTYHKILCRIILLNLLLLPFLAETLAKYRKELRKLKGTIIEF